MMYLEVVIIPWPKVHCHPRIHFPSGIHYYKVVAFLSVCLEVFKDLVDDRTERTKFSGQFSFVRRVLNVVASLV